MTRATLPFVQLVGATEIARMFGVTRQAIDYLARNAKDFPKPVAVLDCGRIWRTADVARWARKTGREIRE